MIVVTGGAGFIGSCIVSKLNQRGIDDIIIVDNLNDPLKEENIKNKKYIKYYDKRDFIYLIAEDQWKEKIECIIHMGACSSTTLQNAFYYRENNLEYTTILSQWAMARGTRFIYASSAATYGDGAFGYKDDEETICKCKPLNLYGASKQNFDLWALKNGFLSKMVGLKFFNVFGPNEYHKKDMRSVVLKSYKKVMQEGRIELFKSYRPEYADGQQVRDFIYVKDAVDVVLFFLDNPNINGIFNVGTGRESSWNDLANALFKASRVEPHIEYIDMPVDLRDRYQYYTKAEMSKLRNSGYRCPFRNIEDAVGDYVGYLKNNSHL